MPVDVKLIMRFPLLANLPEDQRRQLAFKAKVRYFQPRDLILAEGVSPSALLFLVQGQALLTCQTGAMQSINDDSPRVLSKPLAPMGPSPFSIYAQTVCAILFVDSATLELNAAPPARIEGYDVEEIETEHAEVLIEVLQRSRIMLKIPASNIQAVVQASQEVPFDTGAEVVRQGDAATDYFIVKNGRFRVTRRDTRQAQATELAILPRGCGFGEDAVISNGRRNASVVAMEPGTVLRLSKRDFTRLVVNPVLNPISTQQAAQLVERGAVMLDVRNPEQYQQNGLPDSINISLPRLRANLSQLDRGRNYVLYCDNGNLSAAGAFVLSQFGYGTFVLAGGLGAATRL